MWFAEFGITKKQRERESLGVLRAQRGKEIDFYTPDKSGGMR
jgi:hypothetical protein